MMGVESNSSQYFPAANARIAPVHPGIARRREGQLRLASLEGPGLGYRWDEIA
jgi:hypothetical protein